MLKLTPGVEKPKKLTSGYSKGFIVIPSTNIVIRYRINAFEITENKPKVTSLIGKLIILIIGFKTKNIKARSAPPIKIVSSPPAILTPGTTEGRAKSAKV